MVALLPSSSGESTSARAGTLRTSRRSSGFSIQQETPAGWKAGVSSQDLISVLLLMLEEKACLQVLLKHQG